MRYLLFFLLAGLLIGPLPTLAQTHPTPLSTDSSAWLDSLQHLSLSQQVVAVQQRAWRDTLLAPYQTPGCRMGVSAAARSAVTREVPVSAKPWGLPLLYVVNGQQFYNNDVATITRLQQALRSHPIKQVTILRDGTAAALYGARAANGVVLSNTKAKKSRDGTATSRAGVPIG